jgi:hypothetical protein
MDAYGSLVLFIKATDAGLHASNCCGTAPQPNIFNAFIALSIPYSACAKIVSNCIQLYLLYPIVNGQRALQANSFFCGYTVLLKASFSWIA